LCGDRLLEQQALPLCENVMQSMATQEEMQARRDAAAVVKNHVGRLAEMVLQLAGGEGREAKPPAEVVPLVVPQPSGSQCLAEASSGVAGGQLP
jgi:hypothetical protein